MSESTGTKFNRKFFQFQTHMRIRDKTQDFDLKSAKTRVLENKKLYKHILRNAEILQVQSYQPIQTLKETAELINDQNIHQRLSMIDQVGFETISEDLLIPLKQHIEHYDTLQRKIEECHKTRVDMDRHKVKLDHYMRKRKTTSNEGKIRDYQMKYDTAQERYSRLRSEIMEETSHFEEERYLITRPIMTSLLLSYTRFLDNVTTEWESIREIMKETPPSLTLLEHQKDRSQALIPARDSPSQKNHENKEDKVTKQAKCLYDYTGEEENEINIKEGDVVKILKQEGEWCYGECNGTVGYFPTNYVRII